MAENYSAIVDPAFELSEAEMLAIDAVDRHQVRVSRFQSHGNDVHDCSLPFVIFMLACEFFRACSHPPPRLKILPKFWWIVDSLLVSD
jgi:hypothetical protein